MGRYRVFDIGHSSQYFDDEKNKEIIQKVAQKCYIPTNTLLLALINKYKNTNRPFKISYSITGTVLEQLEKYVPEVIESFKALAATGCVEFVAETYYHSLAFLYSLQEFREQITLHTQKIKSLFNQEPKIFRNTELIYNNALGKFLEGLGYEAVLTEGADHIMSWRNPNYVHTVKDGHMRLLLKNYKLSDDIAFRFGDKGWKEYPLSPEKYARWIHESDGHSVNLFIDYETFGEHQWEDTGIFTFLEKLPDALYAHPGTHFVTVSELVAYPAIGELDIPEFISWADLERDLSAWRGNSMQNSALKELYAIEDEIKQSHNQSLIDDWRKLTTSDHFYYMCTKYFNDGDVHKYFNPYDTPYESYINFMNILNDIVHRLNRINRERKISHDMRSDYATASLPSTTVNTSTPATTLHIR